MERKSQAYNYLGFIIVRVGFPYFTWRVMAPNFAFIGCRDTLQGAKQLALDVFNAIEEG